MTLSSHQRRLLTALVLLPVIIWVIFQNDCILASALFVVGSLGLYEYCSMFWQGRKKFGFLALGVALGGIVALVSGPAATTLFPLGTALIFLTLALVFLITYSAAPTKASFADTAVLLGGVVYLPVILHLFRALSPLEMILVLLSAFATDTGGFYAGCLWGKRKIWPRISPKKTWLGSLGGMSVTIAVCLTMGILWGASPWWTFVLLGMLLNIAAQLGDFFESALKRSTGVKDSGHLLPGHGGIMDRIDSLLFTLPVYVSLTSLVAFF